MDMFYILFWGFFKGFYLFYFNSPEHEYMFWRIFEFHKPSTVKWIQYFWTLFFHGNTSEEHKNQCGNEDEKRGHHEVKLPRWWDPLSPRGPFFSGSTDDVTSPETRKMRYWGVTI
jgi:hypothetical protein